MNNLEHFNFPFKSIKVGLTNIKNCHQGNAAGRRQNVQPSTMKVRNLNENQTVAESCNVLNPKAPRPEGDDMCRER